MDRLKYFKENYLYALNAYKKFGIHWIVILAQGGVESGYGTSFGARNRKNHFGITAAGSTNEYWDGTKSQASTGLWFRVYRTTQDSFYDFARLIKSKYTTAAALSDDYKKYAQAIAYSPYINEANGDNRPAYQANIINNSEFILKNINQIAVEKKNPDQQEPG